MSIRVGKPVPNFIAKCVNPDNSVVEFNLEKNIGSKYLILLFYPLDFTFVCPTEIIAVNNRLNAFNQINAEPLLISVDSEFSHIAWKNTPIEQGGIDQINVKMLSDLGGNIAKMYNIETDNSCAYRATFIIDKQGILRHYSVNDLPLGRNVDEIIRLIEAIEFTEKHGEVCPASWEKGRVGMKPTQTGTADFLISNKDKI